VVGLQSESKRERNKGKWNIVGGRLHSGLQELQLRYETVA
jgi:hypothetical protein